MAEFQEGNFVTIENDADLSEKQFYIVKETSAHKAVLAGAADVAIVGVLNNAPKPGWGADVAVINGNGTFKVVAGGNIAYGNKLTSDANGKAVLATTGQRCFGIARGTAAANEVVEYFRFNGVA
jgi:uncharacterized protein YcfJ